MQTLTTSDLIRKRFIGTDNLRKRLTEILDKLPEEKEIIITHHGMPKAILMDLNYYTQLQNRIAKPSNKK